MLGLEGRLHMKGKDGEDIVLSRSVVSDFASSWTV